MGSEDVNEIGTLLSISFEDYQKAPGINQSGLKEILRSPAHYQASLKAEPKDTEAMRFGRIFHTAILEPQLFRERHVIEPKFDRRTKQGKLDFDVWKSGLRSDAILIPSLWEEPLLAMIDKVLSHKLVSDLLPGSLREVSLFWDDIETGERCKARYDLVTADGVIVDFKTTLDARPYAFAREIWNREYHVQVSHYCNGAHVSQVGRGDQFIFIAIEKNPPYELAVYPAGLRTFSIGDHYRSQAMHTYSRCKKENRWPGYNEEAFPLDVPAWAENVDIGE